MFIYKNNFNNVHEVELSWLGGMIVSIFTHVQISLEACSLNQYL